MIPPEGQSIIKLVSQYNYWQALGISRNASVNEISTAHLRLCHKFREFPEVISSLHLAKAEIRRINTRTPPRPRTPFTKRLRIFSDKLLTTAVNISMSGLVRFSAMVGTILVLRRLHSIPLTILVVAVSFLFIRAIQKGKFESPGYIISVLSLLWGGFSASVYLALGKIVPTWQIARVVIGVVAGFGLTIYLGAFLLGKITQKFHKPSLWKCIGIFCALFMLTFGLTYLFFSDQQVVRAKPPQTHEFVQPIPPIPQPPSPKVTEPAKIELLKPVGGIGGILLSLFKMVLVCILFWVIVWIYYGTEWQQKISNFSEIRFYFAFLFSVIFTTRLINEAMSYIPVVGKYIGAEFNIPRQVSEPIAKHFAGFCLYHGIAYLLIFPLYLIYINLAKNLFKKSYLSLMVRILVFVFSMWVAFSWVNTAMVRMGCAIPAKVGYAASFDSLTSKKHKLVSKSVVQPQNIPTDKVDKDNQTSQLVSQPVPQESTVSSESKELSTPTPVNIPKVDEESFQLVSQSTPQESTLPSESEKVSTSDVVNAPDINGSKKAMLNSKEADEEPFWLWGEVISVDPYKKELLIKYLDYETDEEKTILITVDNKTTYENIKSLDEIELHSEISVDYIISQDGKNIAKNIRIESVRDVRVDYKNSKDIIPLEISDLSIVGIIFDKRNPTVIIDNKKTKELKVFKEGDYILEKIKIEEIEKDKILLNNDGRKVELFLNP